MIIVVSFFDNFYSLVLEAAWAAAKIGSSLKSKRQKQIETKCRIHIG
jgi:hypothetical protein